MVLAFEALTDSATGTTTNIGVIGGGTAANAGPENAFAEIDVRVESMVEAGRVEAFVAAYEAKDPDVKLTIAGGLNRPPYETTPAIAELFSVARQVAAEIGFELHGLLTGGGSDGNFTAATVATLDGLGADGSGAHTRDENIRISSLVERYGLFKGLLERLVSRAGQPVDRSAYNRITSYTIEQWPSISLLIVVRQAALG